MKFSDIFSGNARRRPDDDAYAFGDRRWTWAQADERANRLAHALRDRGVRIGDRAILLADNSNFYVDALLAFAKAGAIAVPMSPKSVSRDLRFVLDETQARALFVGAATVKRLPDLHELTADLDLVVGMGAGHALRYDHDELIAGASAAPIDLEFGDDTIRTIKFTSGTTGDPKGCIGSYGTQIFHMLTYLAQTPHIPDGSVGLIPLSLGTGLALNTFAGFAFRNACTIITDRFDPAHQLGLIETERVRRIIAVPTLIGALVEEQLARPRDLSSLKEIFYSGAPISAALMRRATEALGCGFTGGYGSTESGGNVTYISPEEHVRLANGAQSVTDAWGRSVLSCGREVSGAHIRLVDDSLRDVPEGDVGEIAIKWPALFGGYWNKPEATAKTLVDGWLVSGDMGRRDADGFYYIVDRKRDMIVTGGYNVYAIEVESTLAEHPAVAEAAVVGLFDAHWGEAVHAFVIVRPGMSVTENELAEHCRALLSAQKVPKVVHLVADLPRTSTGKVRKGEVRELYRTATSREGPLLA